MNKFASKDYWSESWKRHIDTYLIAPPRLGCWIETFFSKNFRYLEIASGSCRDSIYLASRGYNIYTSDFDKETQKYVKKKVIDSKHKSVTSDSFNLSFRDKSFDVTFSNGFWVCFRDNQELISLIREQDRITSKYMISLVHNLDNEFLVRMFSQKAQKDSLYDIRFFSRTELRKIIEESGISFKKISFHKFGGKADILYSRNISKVMNVLRPVAHLIVPRIYSLQPWEKTERIACVVELDK